MILYTYKPYGKDQTTSGELDFHSFRTLLLLQQVILITFSIFALSFTFAWQMGQKQKPSRYKRLITPEIVCYISYVIHFFRKFFIHLMTQTCRLSRRIRSFHKTSLRLFKAYHLNKFAKLCLCHRPRFIMKAVLVLKKKPF